MTVQEHKSAHVAMATTFEVRMASDSVTYARQIAQVAFAEIDRLEKSLSRFVQSSDIAQINHFGGREPVRVNIETIECLRMAEKYRQETHGAFDITRAGKQVHLCEDSFTVRLQDEETNLDLGGIGKGYALDKAAELLAEWDVESALLHGGESSVLAIGAPPGKEGWVLGVGAGADDPKEKRHIALCDSAISASGTELKGDHIQDPRTGRLADGAIRVWVAAPEAVVTDILATAFMVLSLCEIEAYCIDHPEVSALLLVNDGGHKGLLPFGKW